jgi:hypothetical protein
MDDEPWSDDESWRGDDSRSGGEPAWQDSDGPGWQLPRGLAEVRERWASDTALRLIAGIAVVAAIACVLACSGWQWLR